MHWHKKNERVKGQKKGIIIACIAGLEGGGRGGEGRGRVKAENRGGEGRRSGKEEGRGKEGSFLPPPPPPPPPLSLPPPLPPPSLPSPFPKSQATQARIIRKSSSLLWKDFSSSKIYPNLHSYFFNDHNSDQWLIFAVLRKLDLFNLLRRLLRSGIVIRFYNHGTSQRGGHSVPNSICSLFVRYYSPYVPMILLEIRE